MYDEIHEILNAWLQEAVPYYKFGGIAFKRRAILNEGGFPESYILDIYTDVPGCLVGKAGSIVDKYKTELVEKVKCCNITDINIFEVEGFTVKPVDKKKMKKYLKWAKHH